MLSNILQRRWADGATLRLADLIGAIQDPGFDKLGVMDLEAFYPAKKRFEFAMRLNGLLAAPGFDVWMQGDRLDPAQLFYTSSGKPRVSVLSIAHLNDAQRMFFVTLLLSEIIAWMRLQSGSSSLRAILYMDEIFGYLPPVANPASKQLFLTLLKQARAYGLGLVLATQNPVDLDYKALSNAGTWFIGRLQTDRDKERVREGLQGAAGSSQFSGSELDATLSGLGKRRFLLHNVHEKSPVVFATRWVMSYLAGPLTRDQIKRLAGSSEANQDAANRGKAGAADVPVLHHAVEAENDIADTPPVLSPSIRQCFLPRAATAGAGEGTTYFPALLAAVELHYSDARKNLDHNIETVLALELDSDDLTVDWDLADELSADVNQLRPDPEKGARYFRLAASLASPKNLVDWESAFKRWVKGGRPLKIWRSDKFNLYSEPQETEAEFRIRLQHAANEARDIKVAKLKGSYETKVARLDDRIRRARQALEREAEQARGAKVDTALSIGTAVLGALLGRKRISTTSVTRAGTAVRKAGSASKQAGDVKRARETIASLEDKLSELASEFDTEVDALDDAFDAQQEKLSETLVRPKSTEIEIKFFGIGWIPRNQ